MESLEQEKRPSAGCHLYPARAQHISEAQVNLQDRRFWRHLAGGPEGLRGAAGASSERDEGHPEDVPCGSGAFYRQWSHPEQDYLNPKETRRGHQSLI